MNDENYLAGIAAAKRGDWEKACKLFIEAVKQDPKFVDGWLALGCSLKDFSEKEFCFKRALALDPENKNALRFLQKLHGQRVALSEDEVSSKLESIERHSEGQRRAHQNASIPILPMFLVGTILGILLVGAGLLSVFRSDPPALFKKIAQVIVESPDAENLNEQVVTDAFTPTLTQISIPSPTSTLVLAEMLQLDVSQRITIVNDDVELALRAMQESRYTEAVLIWDEIIATVPEYAEAYFQRGVCYDRLTETQRIYDETLAMAQRAYTDFTRAIELGPPKGEYYYMRAISAGTLAGMQEFYVDKLPYLEQNLEDRLQAYALGDSNPWETRSVGIALRTAGYCKESLDYFLRLEEERSTRGRNKTRSGSIPSGIADAYYCLGDIENAVTYKEVAINNAITRGDSTEDYVRDYARFLYAQGRYEEALDVMNVLIEAMPYYGGNRYYIRALLHYALGQPELAQEDIEFGAGQTWGQYGVRAYVLGQLALDEGDEEMGLYWLQLAEASLSPTENPVLLASAREMILQLDGNFLYPIPSPTEVATRTPIPVVADYVYFTPTPPAPIPEPILVNFSGTGFLHFSSGEAQVFLFRPQGYHTIEEVVSLSVYMLGVYPSESASLRISFLPIDGGDFGKAVYLSEGENRISDPESFVTSAGYVYVKIINMGLEPTVIDDVRIRLEAIDPEGTEVVYGYVDNE
jgi:tetratricopeptide (TPR) repeat protein